MTSIERKEGQKGLLIAFYRKSNEEQTCVESLEELESLAHTYGLKVVEKVPILLRKIISSTIMGSGKLKELCALVDEHGIDLIIFDDEISPHQQRNLEKAFKKPVIDRTELIIEVFAQRAQTKEASLQVELAKIRYQMPRLKRMWTHLSRQAGAGIASKGEGEKQIELDKRMLSHRITRLNKELEQVRSQRKIQRSARKRSQVPTFAIVGYTNVGKSTLLRALTQAEVLVEDKLFATLDTTTRQFFLPNKQKILLVDTVGFIKKIPTTLIAAFKSTLEEAVDTDIFIHMIDASSRLAIEQAEATLKVLKDLGAENIPILTVLNKIDRCSDLRMVQKLQLTYPNTIQISALSSRGFTELMDAMSEAIATLRKTVNLNIPQSHYALVSELMKKGRVISVEYEEDSVLLKVEIPTSLEEKVEPFIR